MVRPLLRRPASPRLETLEDRCVPATLLALTDANQLLRFDSATPNATTAITVSGLNTGEQLLGIDYRPANGTLYAVTSQARLLTLTGNFTTTGTTATVGTALTLAADPADTSTPFTAAMLTGAGVTSIGLDFNPVPDRLRVVTNEDTNLRINVDTGRVTTDPNVAFPGTGDANSGDNPFIAAVAYRNNFAGTATAPLFGLEDGNDILVSHTAPPTNENLGTIGSVGTGLDVTAQSGFDILTTGGGSVGGVAAARTDTAYATLDAAGLTGLYTVDLATGTATAVAAPTGQTNLIGLGTTNIRGLAVVPAGTFNFSAASYAANENGGAFTVTVTRTGGSLGAANVDYAVTAGSATAGADFTATPPAGTLTFAAGETSKTFTVQIIDDQIADANETIRLELSNATADTVIGATGTSTITINDNESATNRLFAVSVNATTGVRSLIEFNPATPGTIRRTLAITGLSTLAATDVIRGIDFQPSTGTLFGLVTTGTTAQLITISTLTGSAVRVGGTFAVTAGATGYSFDFNPTNGNIRVQNDAGDNLSVNPATGAATAQGTFAAAVDPTGAAYTNSFQGAAFTTLYVIDSTADTLNIQANPAVATLATVGPLGVDVQAVNGFDITANDLAFASSAPPAPPRPRPCTRSISTPGLRRPSPPSPAARSSRAWRRGPSTN
ncbi:MAG: DUF4394 domain-containing protein [Gemmataceae bacterium]|nr:DUF4394 domain-containing protein [Gemmataceae bacterium]